MTFTSNMLGIIVLLTLVIPSQGGQECTPRPDLSSDCEITVDRVDDYSTPWSHYLFPGMGSDPFGIAIFNQLSQTDGQCLAVYDDTFMPPLRWVDSIVVDCNDGASCSYNSYLDGYVADIPNNTTFICLNNHMKPQNATTTCQQRCGDIELTGSIQSNEAGGSYDNNTFSMYILGIQSTYHTNSHEFKVTLKFTRFNLDPVTGGRVCGVEGDYVELFNTSSLEYTVLCGNEGLNLVIETTHTHYLTFHTDNVEGGGTGFKLEYTLEPYQKITPGFRNFEMSYYGSSVPCGGPPYYVLSTYSYLINQRRQDDFTAFNMQIKDAYNVKLLPSSTEDISVSGPDANPEVCEEYFDLDFDDENLDQKSGVLFGYRSRTENSNFTSKIEVLREVFGLDIRADTEPVFSEPWINIFNNTIGFAALSSISPDTTDSVWGIPETADNLYQLNQLVHTNYDECEDGWLYFSHQCYHLVDTLLSFEAAQQGCEALDSTLVHWDHVAYHNFFTYWQTEGTWADAEEFWIGARRMDGEWIYTSDNKEITFPAPMTHEFDAQNSSRDCVIAEQKEGGPYLWTNVDCDSTYRSICMRNVGYHIGRQAYNQKYTSPSHMSYDIELPEGYTARVDFTHLDYPEKECLLGSCSCDAYVEVVDGDADTTIRKLCGSSENPPVVYTGTNSATVKHTANDDAEIGDVFSAVINSVYSGCTVETILHRSYQGYVSSPGYPIQGYTEDLTCQYVIGFSRVPNTNDIESFAHGVKVLVEFDSLFDLENSNDSLTFYDGPDTTHPLLYKVGGQKTPPSFRSTSSVITVVFHSDDGVNGAGFAFKYTIGCDETRAPSLDEEFVVPGIYEPSESQVVTLPNIKCTTHLQFPKQPYVSFGAGCDSDGWPQSVACYGTNFDQSTHLPRVSVDSDEYLFNADSKLVDSFWYYHFGEETLDFNSQGDKPLRMMARPKGNQDPLLLLPLYDNLEDHSKYSNTILYNQTLEFPDDIVLDDTPDPWMRRVNGSVSLGDELNLRVELPTNSPLRKLQSFTVVFWLQVLDGSCTQGQQLFEFRSESSYGTAPEGLFVQIDDCAALLADGDDYFSEYMFDSDYEGWHRAAFIYNSYSRKLLTYIDGEFVRWLRPHFDFTVNTDFPILVIGSTYDEPNTGKAMVDLISCFQIYSEPLSFSEIEQAHFKCAPELAADVFFPLDGDLDEYSTVRRLTGYTNSQEYTPVPGVDGRGMNLTNVEMLSVSYDETQRDGIAFTVTFSMNVESAEDEEIFSLHVPDQDRGLIVGRTASDNLYVTLYDVANNPAATFETPSSAIITGKWQHFAIVAYIPDFDEDGFIEIWIDDSLVYEESTTFSSPGLPTSNMEVIQLALGNFATSLDCLQLHYRRLFQQELVEAEKVCHAEPAMNRLADCDPGWTSLYRNSTKETYCVKYLEDKVDALTAQDKCEEYGATHLLYGDFETVYSSSFISDPAWYGIYNPVTVTTPAAVEYVGDEETTPPWLWRAGYWLQPGSDTVGSVVEPCELLPYDPNSICSVLIKIGAGGIGCDRELLITRNTPEPTGNKAPQLLNIGPVFDSREAGDYDVHVVCARKYEPGIQMPLGVCHKFSDTTHVAGECVTGLYVPQFYAIQAVIGEGDYVTCSNRKTLTEPPFTCYPEWGLNEYWFDPAIATVLHQHNPIQDSFRFPISYVREVGDDSLFQLTLYTHFTGYGTGHPNFPSSKYRLLENALAAEPKQTFSRGYLQLKNDSGLWENVCSNNTRALEFVCQQMTGFQCNSVTYGYLDVGIDTGSVPLAAQHYECDLGDAMWVECDKCYQGYRAYETYSSHLISPGYAGTPRSYPPNTYREYQIKDQIAQDETEYNMAIEFEEGPKIDCANGDELYAVAIPFASSPSSVIWSHCDDEIHSARVIVPGDSLLVFRSSDTSTGADGFKASTYQVCGDDLTTSALTAFSQTIVRFDIPITRRYECTRLYTVEDESLTLLMKSNYSVPDNATQFSLQIGYGDVPGVNLLVDIDGDYSKLSSFSGHSQYWISYSHTTVEVCDDHPTQAVVTTPITIELQPVYYDKIRNRAEGQFYPPQFMYNNESLVTENHIAIWAIEKVYSQSLFRLDFHLPDFGIPCLNNTARSWLRIVPTDDLGGSLAGIYYSGESLFYHVENEFRDQFVCDEDVDPTALSSDTVHWYPSDETCDESYLLVILIVDPGMPPITGFTATFSQFDISTADVCVGGDSEYVESSTFSGLMLSTPFQPREMPHYLTFTSHFQSVNNHIFRLDPIYAAICDMTEFTVKDIYNVTIDLCSQLTGLTDDLFYDADELLVIRNSTASPPDKILVRNDESSGRKYQLNFHLSLDDVHEGCVSSDTAGYPTTFLRSGESGELQKITMNLTDFDDEECDKECCHMFTYGSGSKIGQNAKATLCADSESVTFYTQNDEAFWAQIHVDPALPTITRPTVQFCFKHVEYLTYTALAGSFGHTHTFDDLHDVIYFVNVPEGYRIRITFLDKEVDSDCEHKVLLGEDDPLSVLNMENPPEPVCLGEESVIITTTSNEFWTLYTTEPHHHFDSTLHSSYQAFSGCTDLTLPINEPRSVLFDEGMCDITVTTAPGSIIRINLLLDPTTSVSEGYIGQIKVVDKGTGKVLLDEIIKDNSPLAVVSDTNSISVAFSEFIGRRKRQVITELINTEGALIQFLALDEALGCHIDLTDHEGTISSERYTDSLSYQPNTLCTWTLPIPENAGERYQIDFGLLFEVEKNALGYCNDFILLVYSDGSVGGGPYCGDVAPFTIYTKVNENVSIVFSTDTVTEQRGWTLNYKTVFGLVHETNGMITSESYPSNYPPNLHVTYGISVPEGYRVYLYIKDMDIELCQPCRSCDYMAVYDGLTQEDQVGPDFCGPKPSNNQYLFSEGNQLNIEFNSNELVSGSGFKILYNAYKDCDAVYTEEFGLFTSPGYSHSGMKAGTQCSYSIHAEDDQTIVLKYTATLDLAQCAGECCSYIRVSQGAYKNMPSSSGKQCGALSAVSEMSTGSDLTVELSVAEGADPPADHGFYAMYFTYKSMFSELSGVITLPDSLFELHEEYLNNLYLSWTITVDEDYSLELMFTGEYDLQPAAGYCLDTLEVYHYEYGASTWSPLRPSSYFCTDGAHPQNLYSYNNRMRIVFQSNNWNGASGFTAEYHAIPRTFRTAPGGLVSSLPLSLPISGDVEQDYFIQLPPQYYIDLHFTEWIGINCEAAEMSIGEGDEINVHTYYGLEEYCGEVPAPVFSISNKLWISYVQRAFSASPGWSIASFKAEYVAELRVKTSECTISSPGYPEKYPSHLARSWSIISPKGFVVRIVVLALDIPSPDYVLLGHGINHHENTAIRWNDSTTLPYSPIYSTGNEMWVWFYSHDDNQTGTGFSFDFTFEQREFEYPAAVFSSSVDQNGYYVLNLNETWIAHVRDGRTILLNITIDLPYQLICEAANLTVSGVIRELVGHCGERVETLLETEDNHFSITLQTNGDVATRYDHRGFTVSYAYKPLNGDCHFEHTLCDYHNKYPIEWEIGVGQSTIPGTGQITDSRFEAVPEAHIGDHYLIVHAAGHWPGEKAAVVSPMFERGQRTISFSYLMRGPEVGTLRLLQVACTEDGEFVGEPKPIWSKTGQQSDEWLHVEDFPASGNSTFYALIFEVTLGSGDTDILRQIVAGDILIDDIYVEDVDYEDCRRDITPHYCFNGGRCTAVSELLDPRGFICICPYVEFYGEWCEKIVSNCDVDSCSGRGACYENPNAYLGFWCTCDAGYTGLFCEDEVNECETLNKDTYDTCATHGTCVDMVNGYRCQCDDDFYGELCEEQYLPCETRDKPCGAVERGECVDLVGVDSYRCICLPPYTGEHCETVDQTSHCGVSTCNRTDHHAVCIDTGMSAYCECSAGYYGETCRTRTDYCKGTTCHFGGTCVLEEGDVGFHCLCQPGYTGLLCEREIDNCEDMPCSDIGSRWCESKDGDEFHCACRDGYEGERCESVTDYCRSSPCYSGSTCTPILLGYECHCPTAFTGLDCDTMIDYCSSHPCLNEGSCMSRESSFECHCPRGYEGLRCERLLHQCTPDYCQHAGTCYDTTSGPICVCPDDFDGTHCEMRVDDCLGNTCAQGATCVDSTLSYYCLCPPGYYGRRCTEVKDPCKSNICVAGSCLPGIGMEYSCACDAGFTGDFCHEQIDECMSYPCQGASHCYDQVNDYTCVCEPGRYGDQCEEQVDYCVNNECGEHSVCIADDSGYKCRCDSGYAGRYCKEEFDECSLHPCHNGNCTDGLHSFTCNCFPGYTGDTCQLKTNACEGVLCGNEGSCVQTDISYKCTCPLGITGDNCEVHYDYCDSLHPCHIENTLLCEGLTVGYKCHCKAGWGGHDCSLNLDNCASNPCSTRGYCEDLVNGYTCTCEAGWTGRTCESPVDTCQSSPCHNGGTCNNLLDAGYVCTCPLGTQGGRCQNNIDNCLAVLCQNEGVCQDLINDFRCRCPSIRYAGRYCDIDLLNLPGSRSFPSVSVIDNALAQSGNEELIDLSSEERGPCDFGTSSQSITYIVAHIIALVLLSIVCIIISQTCINREKRYKEKRDKKLARRHHHHRQ